MAESSHAVDLPHRRSLLLDTMHERGPGPVAVLQRQHVQRIGKDEPAGESAAENVARPVSRVGVSRPRAPTRPLAAAPTPKLRRPLTKSLPHLLGQLHLLKDPPRSRLRLTRPGRAWLSAGAHSAGPPAERKRPAPNRRTALVAQAARQAT